MKKRAKSNKEDRPERKMKEVEGKGKEDEETRQTSEGEPEVITRKKKLKKIREGCEQKA